jgi:hypothetical protein
LYFFAIRTDPDLLVQARVFYWFII